MTAGRRCQMDSVVSHIVKENNVRGLGSKDDFVIARVELAIKSADASSVPICWTVTIEISWEKYSETY